MSLNSTRVLRDRKPSRPHPAEFLGSPHQISHSLPQAYGSDPYQNQGYPVSETSTGYNSPASSNWLPDDSSVIYDNGEYRHSPHDYAGNV